PAELPLVRLPLPIRGKTNRRGPQGKDHRAVGFIYGPAERAASRHAAANFSAEKIGLADELRGIGGSRARINLAWRRHLFERTVAQQHDAVGKRAGVLLGSGVTQ